MRTWIIALSLACTAGCAFKASEDECQKACENVAEVSLAHVDQQIEGTDDLVESGDQGKEMARSMATAMVDAVKDECLQQCNDKGTRKRAKCLAEASSVEDLEKCK